MLLLSARDVVSAHSNPRRKDSRGKRRKRSPKRLESSEIAATADGIRGAVRRRVAPLAVISIVNGRRRTSSVSASDSPRTLTVANVNSLNHACAVSPCFHATDTLAMRPLLRATSPVAELNVVVRSVASRNRSVSDRAYVVCACMSALALDEATRRRDSSRVTDQVSPAMTLANNETGWTRSTSTARHPQPTGPRNQSPSRTIRQTLQNTKHELRRADAAGRRSRRSGRSVGPSAGSRSRSAGRGAGCHGAGDAGCVD